MPAILPAEHHDPAARYAAVRAQTEALAAPLSAEDCALQSMPDASPVKWHLAHTTWFFETFVLSAGAGAIAPFDPSSGVLFNSYYEASASGTRARARPAVAARSRRCSRYRAAVDERDARRCRALRHGASAPR